MSDVQEVEKEVAEDIQTVGSTSDVAEVATAALKETAEIIEAAAGGDDAVATAVEETVEIIEEKVQAVNEAEAEAKAEETEKAEEAEMDEEIAEARITKEMIKETIETIRTEVSLNTVIANPSMAGAITRKAMGN